MTKKRNLTGAIYNQEISLSKGKCCKFETALGLAEVYVFDKKAIKNRSYDSIVAENPNRKYGVYILQLPCDFGYVTPFYVGETHEIAQRTRQHENDKLKVDEAIQMILITMPHGNLLHSANNRRFLEHKMAQLQEVIGNCNISHTTVWQYDDERNMRMFYEEILYIFQKSIYPTQLLGKDVEKLWVQEKRKPGILKTGELGRILDEKNNPIVSIVLNRDKTITLLKGSKIATSISAEMDNPHTNNIFNKYQKLIKSGCLNPETGLIVSDYVVESAYELMCLINGNSGNATYCANWVNPKGENVTLPSKKREREKKKIPLKALVN